MDNNYTFKVYDKILPQDREKWFLYIDAIYEADPTKKIHLERFYLNF